MSLDCFLHGVYLGLKSPSVFSGPLYRALWFFLYIFVGAYWLKSVRIGAHIAYQSDTLVQHGENSAPSFEQ